MVKRAVRGLERSIAGSRGQLEGLKGQLEDLGASQRVREASQGVWRVKLGGYTNKETEKHRLKSSLCGTTGHWSFGAAAQKVISPLSHQMNLSLCMQFHNNKAKKGKEKLGKKNWEKKTGNEKCKKKM